MASQMEMRGIPRFMVRGAERATERGAERGWGEPQDDPQSEPQNELLGTSVMAVCASCGIVD
jgi:hypothetical protein